MILKNSKWAYGTYDILYRWQAVKLHGELALSEQSISNFFGFYYVQDTRLSALGRLSLCLIINLQGKYHLKKEIEFLKIT